MPVFTPGASKIAKVSFPVSPAGLDCQAELWLTPDGIKRVDISTYHPFTSTGKPQDFLFESALPTIPGEYKVNLDVIVEGALLYAYQAKEVVSIPGVTVGDILWTPPSPYRYGQSATAQFDVTAFPVGQALAAQIFILGPDFSEYGNPYSQYWWQSTEVKFTATGKPQKISLPVQFGSGAGIWPYGNVTYYALVNVRIADGPNLTRDTDPKTIVVGG